MNDPLLKDLLKPLLVILVFSIIFQIIYENINKGQTKIDKYKEVCEQTGGTVVWNGRNYECLGICLKKEVIHGPTQSTN